MTTFLVRVTDEYLESFVYIFLSLYGYVMSRACVVFGNGWYRRLVVPPLIVQGYFISFPFPLAALCSIVR